MHQERAAVHEQGRADHELIDEDERERFAGTTADADRTNGAPIGEQRERELFTDHDSPGTAQTKRT